MLVGWLLFPEYTLHAFSYIIFPSALQHSFIDRNLRCRVFKWLIQVHTVTGRVRIHPCIWLYCWYSQYVYNVTFSISGANRNLGTGGGTFFWICRVPLAVSYRERLTRIDNGTYHLNALITYVTVRSELKRSLQALSSSLFCCSLCWFRLKAVFSYNYKMAEVVTESHQHTTPSSSRKGENFYLWNSLWTKTFRSSPVYIFSHLVDKTGYMSTYKLPTFVAVEPSLMP